ncbi:MAG: UDP-N-acetylmuramoyl-tripeptide--D-alanyl-D-alanine ligase [Bacillota bacterium]|nr:UDP-N-acetylmuramoyl-tripeptide--D-alanyl-D-alanine ligase [Bacillota bacterium]
MSGNPCAPIPATRRVPPAYEAGAAAAIVGGSVVWGNPAARFAGASFDTRRTGPGEMFVAIPGERTDGHLHLGHAAARGATVLLVQRWDVGLEGSLSGSPGADPSAAAVIRVPETVAAFGRLGASHRSRYQLPVLGVTGSVGKTTVKDMAAHMLERRFDVLATEGNLNSDVGLPVILLRLDARHQVAVLEMAMRGEGQISYLASLSGPRVAIVTSVAPVHLETLGSLEAIARAKAELPRALPPEGLAVVDGDSPALTAELGRGGMRAQYVSFGHRTDAGARVQDERTLFTRQGDRIAASLSFAVIVSGAARDLLSVRSARLTVTIPYPGAHNALNAVAAAAACTAVGLPFEEGLAALADFAPKSAMRLDIRMHGGVLLINDAYNANPLSMRAALTILQEAAAGGRKVAVLGDMLELGPLEAEAHRQLGRDVAAAGVGVLIAHGPASAHAAAEAVAAGIPRTSVHHTLTHDDASRLLLDHVRMDDTLLIKGSRGMAMENIVRAFSEGWPNERV